MYFIYPPEQERALRRLVDMELGNDATLSFTHLDVFSIVAQSSVGQEARRAVLIALGTAPWLVVAGLVEGFLTPSGLGLARAIAIGACLGTVYWSLVLWRGALTDGREPSL